MAKDWRQERRNPSFICVDTRRQRSSEANWPISGQLSRQRGTQRRLSRLDPPPSPLRPGVRSEFKQAALCQPLRGHWSFLMSVRRRMTPPDSPFNAALRPWPALLCKTQPETPPCSFTLGRLLWLYDYIWGFVWLCMYLHHSQLVPINNKAPV